MTKNLLFSTTAAMLFASASVFAQAPVLGTSSDFALFTSNGAVSSTGLSHVTGNVGTNNGSSTNFGNVDGVMHDSDGATAAAAASLTVAYNQLFAAIPDYFPSSLLGNGQTLTPGTYDIGESATLNNTLILNGQGNPNSVFIIKVQGAFSSAAGAQVILSNNALACNVFWKIEGLVDLATNTVMKGTIVANNAAIILNNNVVLEGRALSTTGAVTVHNVTVQIPLGCGRPVLTGPVAPELGTVACYTVFSGNGEVTDDTFSMVTGDVGTNVGLTTGFQEENVTGTIHPNPDSSTAQCAADLGEVYAYLQVLPTDIELLYPATLGGDIELTPHTYLLDGATVLTGTVTLNAQGNEDAVFVLKINGALSTATFAAVQLINGAQAKNVFWLVNGAVNLNNFASYKGTIICNNGAMILNNGVSIEGRALSTNGGVTTFNIDAMMTPGCTLLATTTNVAIADAVQLYPNPFAGSLHVEVSGTTASGSDLSICSMVGTVVLKTTLTQTTTRLDMNLPSGVYVYKVTRPDGTVQTGKLVSKQ